MPTLEELRRKIDTAADVGSVVSTMKTLAAVSIYQYERAVEALADYNRTIEMGFRIVIGSGGHDVARVSSSGRTAAIVFGSDRGMCGQFNEEIVSHVSARAREDGVAPRWVLVVAGERAHGRLLDTGWRVDGKFEIPNSASEIAPLVQEMLPYVERLRRENNVDRLFVFYNRRTSMSSFEPSMVQLLPIDPQMVRRWRDERWQSRSLPIYKTSRREVLAGLVQHYLFVSLFRACAESLASENASRIAAMHAAEKNIEERLEELRGAFNLQRQEGITNELLEVVSGFEALIAKR